MQNRGCDTSAATSNIYEPVKPASKDDQIPPEKLKEMQEYYLKLQKKYPKMKPSRLSRKVAEYYKVKLT